MGNNGPGFGNYLKSISHDMPLIVGHTHIFLLGLFGLLGLGSRLTRGPSQSSLLYVSAVASAVPLTLRAIVTKPKGGVREKGQTAVSVYIVHSEV